MRALSPPCPARADGTPRRLGVELELGGLELDEIAGAVAAVFSGAVSRETEYDYRVDTPAGEFKVEADLELLKRIGRERAEGGEQDAPFTALLNRIRAAFGELVAPCEIVGPPLPFESLARFDDLVARLRALGAEGTRSSLLATYGAQLNPEAPDLGAASITRHLRAFALIHDWLSAEIDVDLSRRVTGWAEPYPDDYVELLAGDYAPDLAALIDDYLDANPTRNRALDMLPLFAHLDEPRVRAAVDDPRIKARPTYHYRLPDSRVQTPGWFISDEWNRWLVVEHVAADDRLSGELAAAYLERRGSGWSDTCAAILAPLTADP